MRVCVCMCVPPSIITQSSYTCSTSFPFHTHTRNFPDEYRKYAIKYYTHTHSRANAISENIPAIT